MCIIVAISTTVSMAAITIFYAAKSIKDSISKSSTDLKDFVFTSSLSKKEKYLFLLGIESKLELLCIVKLYQTACGLALDIVKKEKLLLELNKFVKDKFHSHFHSSFVHCCTEKLPLDTIRCIGGEQIKEILIKHNIPYCFWNKDKVVPGVVDHTHTKKLVYEPS